MAIFDEAGNYVDPSPYAPIPVFGPLVLEANRVPGTPSWFQALLGTRPVGYRVEIRKDFVAEFDRRATFLKIDNEITPIICTPAQWGISARFDFVDPPYAHSHILYPKFLEFGQILHDGDEYLANLSSQSTSLHSAAGQLLGEVRPAWKDSETSRGIVAWVTTMAELSPFLITCLASIHVRVWAPTYDQSGT
jgi:hypothetical protein